MKATKKIIPALVMLLVSAVLLSTASYAWFSMNTQVTATGMSVTAKAPTSLLISKTSATEGFGSTVALTNLTPEPADYFVPVAYAGKAESWYKLNELGMADINQLGRPTTFTMVTDGADSSEFNNAHVGGQSVYEPAPKHVFHSTVWLKVDGELSKNVKASVEYIDDTTAEKIKDAMHVVFVVGGSVVATVDMGGTLTTGELATLAANADGTQVDIYYFLSGNDPDCMNQNMTQDATMSITITFTAYDVTSGEG
ncbi:MAG: hypothetical protein ACOX3X_05195 [Eubacteriales bacterium]|jgi:hypothetical protein